VDYEVWIIKYLGKFTVCLKKHVMGLKSEYLIVFFVNSHKIGLIMKLSL